MNLLHPTSFIYFAFLFLAPSLHSCVLVEDAINILWLIEQAQFTDDYSLRTRNSFVQLVQPNLQLLHKDPQGLMTVFKIITQTEAQGFLEDIRSSCHEFVFALNTACEYNQERHDIAILSLYLLEYIKKVFAEFNLLKAHAETMYKEMGVV